MISLSKLVSRAASVNVNGIATTCDGREQTWPKVLDNVQKMAAVLKKNGLQKGDRVGVLSANSDRYLELLFAVPWSGGITVPINTRLSKEEILYWLNDSGCSQLVVTAPFVDIINEIIAESKLELTVYYIGNESVPKGYLDIESLMKAVEPLEDQGRSAEDIAMICYSGGTTGRSKGVAINHQGLIFNVMQWIVAVNATSDDVLLVLPPMFHAAGCANAVGVAALAATACFINGFDVINVLETIQNKKITNIPLVATMLDWIVNHPKIVDYDLSSLSKITYGASPIPLAVLEKSIESIPSASFYQVFGQTEGGPTVSILPPKYHVTDGPLAGKLTSAGQAVIGTEIAIIDPDGNFLAAGEFGEIVVRGPGVAPFYWNLPEETANSRLDDWLKTGDGGYLDSEGFLFISDRIKDMIVSGGENVYPIEVENVIRKQPDIVECAVIGLPSKRWGEAVVAVVRLAEGSSKTAEQLNAHCRDHLAGFKCPKHFIFRHETLPLSAANKILKRELRKEYATFDVDGES